MNRETRVHEMATRPQKSSWPLTVCVRWYVPLVGCFFLAGCAASDLDSDWQDRYATVLNGDSHTIQLDEKPITAAQIASLGQLGDRLHELLLDAGGVDDGSLANLAGLTKLRHLRIRESAIGDTGIRKLSRCGLESLATLNIPQGQITAEGIALLSTFPSLSNLRLGGQQLDDSAIQEIAKLPELRSLHLIGPNISGAALDDLANAPKLGSFYLDDCPLPDEAWSRLFAAKPSLHVHVDQQHHDRDPKQDHE